jgi:hypothetical protein
MLRAMRSFLGDNDMMAYLAMMAVRLIGDLQGARRFGVSRVERWATCGVRI